MIAAAGGVAGSDRMLFVPQQVGRERAQKSAQLHRGGSCDFHPLLQFGLFRGQAVKDLLGHKRTQASQVASEADDFSNQTTAGEGVLWSRDHENRFQVGHGAVGDSQSAFAFHVRHGSKPTNERHRSVLLGEVHRQSFVRFDPTSTPSGRNAAINSTRSSAARESPFRGCVRCQPPLDRTIR